MMRVYWKAMVLFLVWISIAQSAQVQRSVWKKGETFSEYLQERNVSQDLLREISPEDSKYLNEIESGEPFYELMEGKTLLEALIPIGEEMQIQLLRNLKSGRYSFDIVPIVYRQVKDEAVVEIHKSCYADIDRMTRNPRLGFLLKRLYRGAVNFRKFRDGDRVAFAYRQKSRLGEPWGQPEIRAAAVQMRGKRRFIFVDEEGNGWKDVYKKVRLEKKGKKLVEYTVTKTVKVRSRGHGRFGYPVPGARITSRFTYKRWHPILHRYRPHLGVDWGARRGTPIHAAGDGRVIYAGWMRGYGKVVKIRHGGGYVSLYAHQSRIRVRNGSYVKRGQIIGNVGSTGRSTGPHLHFGLYLNGRAINPLKVLGKSSPRMLTRKVTTHHKKMQSYTKVSYRNVPIPGAARLRKDLTALLEHPGTGAAYRWEKFSGSSVHLEDRPGENRGSKEQAWVSK